MTAAVHYVGIKMFNHLPTHIRNVANETQVFKNNLKGVLLDHSFCPIDKYCNSNKKDIFQIVMT
jgi:BioD-like phosphotransacetylase family protein